MSQILMKFVPDVPFDAKPRKQVSKLRISMTNMSRHN